MFYTFSQPISGKIYSQMTIASLKNEIKKEESVEEGFTKNVNLGLIYYFLASQKEKTSNQAIEYLTKALDYSQDDIVKAYLGSAYLLLADESEIPGLKIKYAKEGFKILDEVYSRNQDNYEITLLYIYSNLEVPQSLFKRADFAVPAIDKIFAGFDSLQHEDQAEILYVKGYSLMLQKQYEEAQNIFKQVIEKYADTRFKELSETKLKKLKLYLAN
jgi:tetratricopeptide (TPR) repeat protein